MAPTVGVPAAIAIATTVAATVCVLLNRYAMKRAPAAFRRAVLGSTAAVKLAAARSAMPSCTVTGVRAESKVRDQPLGFEETLRGARNRLETIMECPEAEEADLAIAIENGIVCVRDGTDAQDENWVDLAIIIVRDLKSGKESLSSSVGLQLPSSTVADWAEAGAEGTLGSWLATERTGCDSQDPHAHLTGGAYPRAALLEQAIGAAYATLRHA